MQCAVTARSVCLTRPVHGAGTTDSNGRPSPWNGIVRDDEQQMEIDMAFIRSVELGEFVVWHLERVDEEGWTMWFDLESQQARVWDSSFPTLDENRLISNDWDKSFSSGKEAWDYIKTLT
jgi:hypothetical protein